MCSSYGSHARRSLSLTVIKATKDCVYHDILSVRLLKSSVDGNFFTCYESRVNDDTGWFATLL